MAGGQEYEPTGKEEDLQRGREPDKGLPSRGDVYSQEISPDDEDTRGNNAFMTPDTAVKQRKKAKKTPDSAPQAPLTQNELQEKFEEQQVKYESLLRENEQLRSENERLRAENEELTRKVNLRKEQNKAASAKRRAKNRDAYNTYERERRSAKSKQEE